MLQQLHINASQHTIIYCQVLLMSHTFSVKKPAVLSLLAAVRFSAGVPSYIFRFCLKLLPFFKHSHIFAVKKTYLRNIHCPADMSESKVTFHIRCRFLRPGPTPSDKYSVSEWRRLLSLYCWSRILFECNAVQREFLQSYGSPVRLLSKDTPWTLC